MALIDFSKLSPEERKRIADLMDEAAEQNSRHLFSMNPIRRGYLDPHRIELAPSTQPKD